MAFFVRPLTHYEKLAIQELLERPHHDPLLANRVKIIWRSHQRIKSGEISRELDVRPATVVRWIKRFNQKGLLCLEERPEELTPRPTEALEETDSPAETRPTNDILYVRSLNPTEIETLQTLVIAYQERSSTLKRLQAILLSSQSLPISRISTELGLSRGTVRLWIKHFNKAGLESLQTATDKDWLARHEKLLYCYPEPARLPELQLANGQS